MENEADGWMAAGKSNALGASSPNNRALSRESCWKSSRLIGGSTSIAHKGNTRSIHSGMSAGSETTRMHCNRPFSHRERSIRSSTAREGASRPMKGLSRMSIRGSPHKARATSSLRNSPLEREMARRPARCPISKPSRPKDSPWHSWGKTSSTRGEASVSVAFQRCW